MDFRRAAVRICEDAQNVASAVARLARAMASSSMRKEDRDRLGHTLLQQQLGGSEERDWTLNRRCIGRSSSNRRSDRRLMP